MERPGSTASSKAGRADGGPEKRASGYLAEVFTSIQGEGIFAGVKQVFVRFGGCSMRCDFCDTAYARERPASCVIHRPGAQGGVPEELVLANPVQAGEAAALVISMSRVEPGIHSLSVTGGEPLDQPAFLEEFLRKVRPEGIPVYLETNGSSTTAARAVSTLVDIVSLDIKLPSLCGGRDLFATYEEVLPVFGAADLFVKVVLAGGFDEDEFRRAVELVEAFDPSTPFVIQPATANDGCEGVPGETLLEAHSTASGRLSHVRVIPQSHHLLGLR